MSRKRKAPDAAPAPPAVDTDMVKNWVRDVDNAKTRLQAMTQLVAHQSQFPDLAVLLVEDSTTLNGMGGELTAILQNILPHANPPGMSDEQSHKVCLALELLKLVAAHPETQLLLCQRAVILDILPFFKSVDKTPPFQKLRQASVGLLEALVRTAPPEVLTYLTGWKVFGSLHQLTDTACDTCKTSAMYVMERLLRQTAGVQFMAKNPRWLVSMLTCLDLLVLKLDSVPNPSMDLILNMLRCYAHLTKEPLCREGVRRHSLPLPMVNGRIRRHLPEDSEGERLYSLVINNLKTKQSEAGTSRTPTPS